MICGEHEVGDGDRGQASGPTMVIAQQKRRQITESKGCDHVTVVVCKTWHFGRQEIDRNASNGNKDIGLFIICRLVVINQMVIPSRSLIRVSAPRRAVSRRALVLMRTLACTHHGIQGEITAFVSVSWSQVLKVGLIADTHMPGTISDLWPEVIDLFAGVDVILHAGDLHTLSVVEELGKLGPVYVARGNGDVGIVDDRLQDAWVLSLGSFTIGMIHHFPSPVRKTSQQLHKYMRRHFKTVPDVVVYGHTHLESIHDVDGVLCVNPGSPTLPRNQSLRYGHVVVMDLAGDRPLAVLYELFDGGFRAL